MMGKVWEGGLQNGQIRVFRERRRNSSVAPSDFLQRMTNLG